MGKRMANPTNDAMTTMTTVRGSPILCVATTVAAAILRWAVPRPSTSSAAVAVFPMIGLRRCAQLCQRVLTNRPAASDRSIVTTSGKAMALTWTAVPGTVKGTTMGRRDLPDRHLTGPEPGPQTARTLPGSDHHLPQILRVVRDPHRLQPLPGLRHPHQHRPAPMQINPDELPAVILTHRGLLHRGSEHPEHARDRRASAANAVTGIAPPRTSALRIGTWLALTMCIS